MAVVLRDFITQWLREQDNLGYPSRSFLVVGVDGELHRQTQDKARRDKGDPSNVVRASLVSWVIADNESSEHKVAAWSPSGD